jgi:hypothetical protein
VCVVVASSMQAENDEHLLKEEPHVVFTGIFIARNVCLTAKKTQQVLQLPCAGS